MEGESLYNATKNKLETGKCPCDRLDLSVKLFIALFLIMLLCLALPVLDAHFCPVDHSAGQVIRLLQLNNLSIIGSGRPLRHPEGIIASVNLNFSPYLRHFMIQPEYLILNPPQYSQEDSLP
jgi:hypothetical protein